jgi:23S rRNA G2445 N2-methylase RlmL
MKLAAGVLLLCGTDKVISWIQCGSGTFLAEAAMIAVIFRQTLIVKNLHSKNGTIGTMICSTISLIVY